MAKLVTSSERPVVSVIIPAFNNAATLGSQLESLADQTFEDDYELIVADNGSCDATIELTRSYTSVLPSLRVVDASDRPGAAHARNIGASAARGEYLLFCDGDDIVGDRWVDAMTQALQEAQFVAGQLDLERLNSAEQMLWHGGIHLESGLRPVMGFLPFASSSNLGIRRSVFEAAGGFDEELRRAQDLDLSWRLQLAGHDLAFAPDAIVHYRLRETYRATVRQQFDYARWQPRIYARFRHRGMRRATPRGAAVIWLRLLLTLPRLFGWKENRILWTRSLILRLGRLVGSVESGTAFF